MEDLDALERRIEAEYRRAKEAVATLRKYLGDSPAVSLLSEQEPPQEADVEYPTCVMCGGERKGRQVLKDGDDKLPVCDACYQGNHGNGSQGIAISPTPKNAGELLKQRVG